MYAYQFTLDSVREAEVTQDGSIRKNDSMHDDVIASLLRLALAGRVRTSWLGSVREAEVTQDGSIRKNDSMRDDVIASLLRLALAGRVRTSWLGARARAMYTPWMI